jgi:folate-dependent phosphoribosylglycinamide formyltransferase PurN
MSDFKRVVVLTQADGLVIPQNILRLSALEGVEVIGVIQIDSSGSLTTKSRLFMEGFGVKQAAKMGVVIYWSRLVDLLDKCTGYRFFFAKSLKSVASRLGASFHKVDNPNSVEALRLLRDLKVELIVSYSAPCVFEEVLLDLPEYGCINLHCSLLPKFAGLLPSFWTLYEGAEDVGATVHRMDSKIDNGAILGQVSVPVPPNPSMFKVIRLTKRLGGELMTNVVRQVFCGEVIETENNAAEGSYYSWPSLQEIRSFTKKGGRLI